MKQTAKYDVCIVMASAVGLKKGSVQRKVRASETGIPPDLPGAHMTDTRGGKH